MNHMTELSALQLNGIVSGNAGGARLLVPEEAYETPSLADTLVYHAEKAPLREAFTFIDYSRETPQDHTLTNEALHARARQVAAILQTRCRKGDRVLLLYPAGIEYLCAFFGCLYAGMIAVPAYPPINPRLRGRLAAVAQDCRAVVALTTSSTLEQLGDRSALLPPLARLQWIATDTGLEGLEHVAMKASLSRDTVAFLQYTSGSTGTPKGVMVTHGNLLANLRVIALHMQFCPEDRHLTWLPPYHDMGMIGAVLGSFAAGVPLDFMMPTAFLRKPERWLKEISNRKITLSGAPNFAYELCLSKVSDQVRQSLDLSSWALAYSGAEPVRYETLQRFSEHFAAAGFQATSFYPCYGMAEATLFATGIVRGSGASAAHIDSTIYSSQRRAEKAQEGSAQRALVSCGKIADEHAVVVVDPETLEMCESGEVGEILISGPSIAAGYWERLTETETTFHVRFPGYENPFLRTGDLGFLLNEEIYISGRVKDLIIIRGVNHYPHDIEATVDHCHPAIRGGCGIAFSIDVEGLEQLVFVQEVGKNDKEDAVEIFASMQRSIAENHEVQPYALVLIEGGTIPKTTSGKLSRKPCKESYLAGQLQVIASWLNPAYSHEAAQPAEVAEVSC